MFVSLRSRRRKEYGIGKKGKREGVGGQKEQEQSYIFAYLRRITFKLGKFTILRHSLHWIFPKARFRRRSIHLPNLTDELNTAKERRLNQFGMTVLVRCGKSVKFDRVCRTFVELNLGSTHGASSESVVAPVSLQSRTYSNRFGT